MDHYTSLDPSISLKIKSFPYSISLKIIKIKEFYPNDSLIPWMLTEFMDIETPMYSDLKFFLILKKSIVEMMSNFSRNEYNTFCEVYIGKFDIRE